MIEKGYVGFYIMADRYADRDIGGRLYSEDKKTGYAFSNLGAASRIIESLLDKDRLIRSSFEIRRFNRRKKTISRSVYMRVKENENKENGDMATFLVKIKHRQNGTFQGSLQWMDENRLINFRSDFEMLKLIFDAMNKNNEEKPVSWEE